MTVIRFFGDAFNSRAWKGSGDLVPDSVFVKGEQSPSSTKTHNISGINFYFSSSEEAIGDQIRSFIEFVKIHAEDLKLLSNDPTVTIREVDFYYKLKYSPGDYLIVGNSQSILVDEGLMQSALEFKIQLRFSIYEA